MYGQHNKRKIQFANPNYGTQSYVAQGSGQVMGPPKEEWENQGARPKMQSGESSDAQSRQTGGGEQYHEPGVFHIHNSWSEVKIDLTVNGVQDEIMFKEDLQPFAIQFAVGEDDFKEEIEIYIEGLTLQAVHGNILQITVERKGNVKLREIRKELKDVIQRSLDDNETLPVSDTDISTLLNLETKLTNAKCFSFKGKRYIYGHKKNVALIKKKLEKKSQEIVSVNIAVKPVAMLLLGKQQFWRQLEEKYHVKVCVDETVTITGYKKEMVDACELAVQQEEASIGFHLLSPSPIQSLSSKLSEKLEKELMTKQVLMQVIESDRLKIIGRTRDLVDVREMMKHMIEKIVYDEKEAHSDDTERVHRETNQDNSHPENQTNVPTQTKNSDAGDIVQTVKKCDRKFSDFLQSHGNDVISKLQAEHNVKISLKEKEVGFEGKKEDIQRADFRLNIAMIAKSVLPVENENGISRFLDLEEGVATLDKVAAHYSCGWTMMQQLPESGEENTMRGVFRQATWTKTLPNKKHHLSLCVVEDYKKADIPVIVVPVFTDQSPFFNAAASVFCHPLVKRSMNLGDSEWTQSSQNQRVLLVAVGEKRMTRNKQEIFICHDQFLQLLGDVFRKASPTAKSVAFAVPQANSFKEWKPFMQNVALLVSSQSLSANLPEEIFMCCSDETVSLEVLNIVHDLFCTTEVYGNLEKTANVLMSKKVDVEVVKSSLLHVLADCIVVVVRSDLDLTQGVVPQALLQMAGGNLIDIAKERHPKPLVKGECFHLELPKPLTCGIKAVIFGCLPKWDKKNVLKILKQFFVDCLHEAGRRGYATLGFSAIGSGYLQYPHRDVARLMFDAVSQYSVEAISGSLTKVTIAILNDDQVWKAMTNEGERRLRLENITKKSCSGCPYLQSTIRGMELKVVEKANLEKPLPSEYAIVMFNVGNDFTSWVVSKKYSSVREFSWNDYMDVRCQNSQKYLAQQMNEVLNTCEAEKLTSIAVKCSDSFAFSVGEQIEVITETVASRKHPEKYLSKLLIIMKNEMGFQNAADRLLMSEKTGILSSLLGSGTKPAWTKHEDKQCHQNIVVFGLDKKQVNEAAEEIKKMGTYPLGPPQQQDEPVKSGSMNRLRGQKKKVHTAGNISNKVCFNKPANGSVQQVLENKASVAQFKENQGELEVAVECKEDADETLCEQWDAEAELNEMILSEIEAKGQKDKTLADIEAKFGVKFKNGFDKVKMCGSLSQLVEAEEFLYTEYYLTRTIAEASDPTEPTPDSEDVSDIQTDIEDEVPSYDMNGIKVSVYKKSLIETSVDGIVSPTNEYMSSSLGVAEVIARKAGKMLKKECEESLREEGYLDVTNCRVTKAGKLGYKCILHVFSPRKSESEYLQKLERTVYNCLEKATSAGLSSVAFPLIGTGVEGRAVEECAKQYMHAMEKFTVGQEKSSLKEVHFVNMAEENVNKVNGVFAKRMDQLKTSRHTQDKFIEDKKQDKKGKGGKQGKSAGGSHGKGSGIGSQEDMTENAGKGNMTGNGGQVNMTGNGGQVNMTGNGQQVNMTGSSGHKNMTGNVGQGNRTGNSGLENRTGHRNRTGKGKQVDRSDNSGQGNSYIEGVKQDLARYNRQDTNYTNMSGNGQTKKCQNPSASVQASEDPYKPSNLHFPSLNLTVYIALGDITENAIDAIVTPQDKKFTCRGRIARQIMDMAGFDYKDSIGKIRQENHQITDAVAVVPGGNLSFVKTVIHAVAPHWDQHYVKHNQRFEEDIAKTVQSCLRELSSLNYVSIAFPLFGTSDCEKERPTPVPTCCRGMVAGLRQFFERESGSRTIKVHFISTEPAILGAFKEELIKQLRVGNVDRGTNEASN